MISKKRRPGLPHRQIPNKRRGSTLIESCSYSQQYFRCAGTRPLNVEAFSEQLPGRTHHLLVFRSSPEHDDPRGTTSSSLE